MDVASPSQILATLDRHGTLEELPFMPEMAAFCGRRFTVGRRAERICDTIDHSGSRRIRDTVFLADLRCDGAAHGRCQAECRLFWKEVWLRKVTPQTPPPVLPTASELEALIERTTRPVKRTVEVEGRLQERWSCQATELTRASGRLKLWDPRTYLREWTTGNVTLGHFLRVMRRAVVQEPLRKLGILSEVHVPGTRTRSVVDEPLHLQPGDLVRVKAKKEIAATLTHEGCNRGLWFDKEMVPHCGGTYHVRQRISRFIDDHEGRMIELKTDCVTLEGVVCSGDLSLQRWFCPRAIYPYWRECWLERIAPPSIKPNETATDVAARSAS